MLKKLLLVVGVAVAGCQGPEAFRGRLGAGATGGAAGAFGGAGTGILPVMVPGAAGTGVGPADQTGAAGAGVLAGAAGASVGIGGPGTAGADPGLTGVAGATAAAGGSGAAGTGAVVVDAGAGGRQGGGFDAGAARDTAPEASAASVAYASTNWKPTASITAPGNADLPPNAFDGKLATRWTTGRNQMGDETFMVDLGQAMPVSRVVLDDTTNAQDFPAAYTLEVSTNGTTFTTVKMGKGATVTDIQFTRTSARYIRIRQTGTTPAGGSWWSIDELRIYS
jgi:hypothetical protein